MFPDARISLRRWSVYAETKIPIPMAITLHNFVAPVEARERADSALVALPPQQSLRERASSTGSANSQSTLPTDNRHYTAESPSGSPSKEEWKSTWHRQPQHTSQLLPRLNLEITAQQQDDNLQVVYSQKSPPTPSLHPSWEHLDEKITVKDCGEDWWNQNKLYKSMKVKLTVVSNQNNNKNNSMQDDSSCSFVEAYLHPSFLERIDLGCNKDDDGEDNDDENMDRNSLLPPGLPPNALLVHFSDGSIRCPHAVYQILWDNFGPRGGTGQLEAPPVEDFDRFEDDAFATLDHVQQTPERPRNRSFSALLDQDNEEDGGNNDSNDNNNTNSSSSLPQHQKDNGNLSPNDSDPVTPPPKTKATRHIPQTTFDFSEQEVRRQERRQEKLELLRLIAEEERALEEDLDILKEEQLNLTRLVDEIRSVERDISKVQTELHKQSVQLQKEEILKESQSIKLIRDLRHVYPIQQESAPRLSSSVGGIIQSTRPEESTTSSYLIRGLRLPADIYTTTISEEEVNTSLGYCSHLVFMVAKYLAVPLRHRIFCNGSRSAIELDGVGIFPLFLGRLAARALEREQVDRGARLLGTNVDCILMHLGLLGQSSSSSSSHILERIQTILDFVAKGRSAVSTVEAVKMSD